MKNTILLLIAILGMILGMLIMPGSPLQAILGWIIFIGSNFIVYDLIYGEDKKDS